MAAGSSMGRTLGSLRDRCRGVVSTSEETLLAASRDFGGMVARRPSVVVQPLDVDDLVEVLRTAAEHEVPVAIRGSGHSQSGQCLGEGIVVDMGSLNRVLDVRTADGVVEVEGGARWQHIVDRTFERGFLPLGLTHVVDTTIGGTLSVAGVGAESWRVGPQVDNVRYLDVAIMDGHVVRCSRHERRDLFDAVRAGLGQCGVIVRAGYPIRACAPRVLSRWYLYRSVERYLSDVDRACSTPGVSYVSGMFVRGTSRGAAWDLVLVVGFEHDGSGPQEVAMAPTPLSYDKELPVRDAPTWNANGVPGHIFFRLYASPSESAEVEATTLHPWAEHVFDRALATRILYEHMDDPESPLLLGTNGLIFIKRGENPAPLFRTPANSDLLVGLGLFANVKPSLASVLVPLVTRYATSAQQAGGARYLSGYLDFSADEWSRHYGSEWENFRQAKDRHDPRGLLNSACVRWR